MNMGAIGPAYSSLTASSLPTLRNFSRHQGDMGSLNASLVPKNPIHQSGYGFAGDPLLGTGLSSVPTTTSMSKPSLNLYAYRPQNLNVTTLSLPNGMGKVVLDPRVTSLKQLKAMDQTVNQMIARMNGRIHSMIAGQGDGMQKDHFDNALSSYSKKIRDHQDSVLMGAMNKKRDMPGF